MEPEAGAAFFQSHPTQPQGPPGPPQWPEVGWAGGLCQPLCDTRPGHVSLSSQTGRKSQFGQDLRLVPSLGSLRFPFSPETRCQDTWQLPSAHPELAPPYFLHRF